jgi:hypothetical protein
MERPTGILLIYGEGEGEGEAAVDHGCPEAELAATGVGTRQCTLPGRVFDAHEGVISRSAWKSVWLHTIRPPQPTTAATANPLNQMPLARVS